MGMVPTDRLADRAAFDTTAAAGDCNLIMMDRPSSPLLLPVYTLSVYEAMRCGDLISDVNHAGTRSYTLRTVGCTGERNGTALVDLLLAHSEPDSN